MGSKITLDEIEIIQILGNKSISSKLVSKLEKALNKKPIKTSSRKAKGRNLQYWVCNKISELTGIPYDQSDDQCLIHSREMGQSGNDIILRQEALKQFPYSTECKNSETLNLVETINQVKANQINNTEWLIVHKRKLFRSPIVIMDWNCFENLYKNTIEK